MQFAEISTFNSSTHGKNSLVDGSSDMYHLHCQPQSIGNAGIEYYTMNTSKDNSIFFIIRRYVNYMHRNTIDRIWSTPKPSFIPNSKALTEVLASKLLFMSILVD